MALEDLTGVKYINSLVSTNPTSTDNKSEGDDHLRGIKNVILQTLPNVTGAVTSTHTELNVLTGITSTTSELNIVHGVTVAAADINALTGANTAGATGVAATPTINKMPVADQTGGRLAWGWKPAFRGALVYKSASVQSIPDSLYTAITFDAESYDTDSIHDTVTNTSRLTVPTGITKIRLHGQVQFASGSTTASARGIVIYKNGSVDVGVPSHYGYDQFVVFPLSSAVVSVTGGDYFELMAYQSSGGALNASVNTCWFAMEIIE